MSNRQATARFRISTHDSGYYCVSIPKYEGGEVVHAADYDVLLAEVGRLRDALEPFTNNGRVFIFHRNAEAGDYFECLFCNREGPRWREIPHNQKCLIAQAHAALSGKEGE
jgi:hypothetical protein